MADTDNDVELDVTDSQETEIEVTEDKSQRENDSSEDQFSKAENSTQKRINLLAQLR